MDGNVTLALRGNVSILENYEKYSTAQPSSLNDSHAPFDNSLVTLPTAYLAVVLSLRVIWSILVITGNSLTIYAVTRFSSLQTSTNYLVASLAVGDFITGLLTPAVILHHVFIDHPIFVPICLVEKTFSLIAIRANYINILWIAIDRFLYIAYPLQYPIWQTKTKTITLIVLTWGYVMIESPLLLHFGNVLKPRGICQLIVAIKYLILIYYILPQMLICLALTIICYTLIAKIAHKQSIAIAALHSPFETLEASINYRQKKIAKMMFAVLASFLLSYTPQILLIDLVVVLQNKRSVSILFLERVTTLIYYTNGFINPMIYAWKSKEHKEAFKKILHLKADETTGPEQT